MTGYFPVNALQSALGGLNVSQQLLDVTAQNISNAQTAGYTKKTLPVTTDVADGQVIGVDTGNITRNVDQQLQSSYWAENSTSAQLSTVNTALSSIQSLYGTADAGTNFSAALTTLKGDFTQLSATPSSTTLQQQTVTDAQTFASALNQTAQTLTQQRNAAETNIATSVTTINSQLQTIATLNTQIAQTIASGQSPANLQDQRDDAIETLSTQIGVSTYTRSDGVEVVQTTQGQTLADTTAHSLVFTPQPIGTQTAYPMSLSGVTLDSASGFDLASTSGGPGGTLGGLLQLRDQILPQQQAQVDELAEQTANRFSAQGVNLFTDSSGNIPHNTPNVYTGFASTITVNPAVSATPDLLQQGTTPVVPPATPLQSGDNSLINNVLNYTFGADKNSSGAPNTPFNVSALGIQSNISLQLPATSTLENFAQQILTSQATQAANVTSQSSFSSNYLATLKTSLSNQSGVNLDSEVANLTIYENSYSSSAQIVQTEQKLMQDLLSVVQGA